MISKVSIRNFKKLEYVEFELGNTVVLIGPNNSGKTTILQALTLWDVGIKKLSEYVRKNSQKSKKVGFALNRRDLLAIPVSSAKYVWFHQAVRELDRQAEKLKTTNIRIEIIVEGITNGISWKAPLEFDYANSESIYCRPMKDPDNPETFFQINEIVFETELAFLQPMSGLATTEDKLTQGSIKVRIGEGKTADVLRNVCYQLMYPDISETLQLSAEKNWQELTSIISEKFSIKLNKPLFIPETGSIEMTYEENGHTYDLVSSGRGFQQTLLLLAYLYSYPGRTILLDEPDAHLEVIRQREIYELINKIASGNNSQLIIASHSEIVLNQAAANDTVIALFDDKCLSLTQGSSISQFKKLLTDIGWDKYFIARTKKHILFLEGPTDLRILQAFAQKLNHPCQSYLEKANIQYTADNLPKSAQNLFHGLRNIIPELNGLALFDRLEKKIQPDNYLRIVQWKKREIENYFSFPEVLERWASNQGESNLFKNYYGAMSNSIKNNTAPVNLKNRENAWWSDNKMSDDYLPQIFNDFYNNIGINYQFPKGRYHELIDFILPEEIDSEIADKLDDILNVITNKS
ncbi:MAG: ATP-dependent nuclease [Bacteroidota bacterium]